MSQRPSAICLVIDRLSAAYLGALGNTWIHTPAFDQIAAESIVFDRAMTDSPALDDVYQSYWNGEPAWLRARRSERIRTASLLEFCQQQGLPTVILTDDIAVANHPLAAAFDEVIQVNPSKQFGAAADWQETQLAQFFAAAIELLEATRQPRFIWLHTGALGRIWDSPQSLRTQYTDEDDPAPPTFNKPPSLMLSDDADPDMLLGLRHAYAGEVSVLDHCLGLLLDTLAGGTLRDALFCVTSPRGYPLGEHGYVGDAAESLYGELLHVPLMLRLPGGPAFGARNRALVQSADVCALLQGANQTSVARELTISRASSGETAIATAAWFVRASLESSDKQSASVAPDAHTDATTRRLELFVKPDDYHEVNEVSDRCHEIVAEFQQLLLEIDKCSQEGRIPRPVLSETLIHGLEGQNA